MMSRLRLVLPTLWRLGPGAAANVAAYRLACRTGLYRQWLPIEKWEDRGTFFAPNPMAPPAVAQSSRTTLLNRADRLLAGELVYFSSTPEQVGNPPDWFLDPFSQHRLTANGHWSALDEFSAGDIKKVWEASRFEWAPLLARAWRLTNDDRYLATLNSWVLDWVRNNPVNAGPNWKCGQETSIRLINLLLTAHLLGRHEQPSPSLVNLVAQHCGRILPTIHYAVAQNNNHGTSEAAALFIGGAWLLAKGEDESLHLNAIRWRNAGRRWLEDRVTKLVAEDGSFSQYSVNYHRVLVDTLCQVEFWRRVLQADSFSDNYAGRCRAAVAWLAMMTDADTGNAPNLGANDGARLYDLSAANYRDFRPTVQLASVLLRGSRAYGPGAWDEPLEWLGVKVPDKLIPPGKTSVVHDDGGDLVLYGDHSRALVRYARFRFRPSHADCLHFDLWHQGQNILRDGGTYSYNTEARWLDYFSGTASHNTVQFDDRNQMPRIGRFLFGAWLKMDDCSEIRREGDTFTWSGAYTDWQGARHRRTVSVSGDRWLIRDELSGYRHEAVLRWRLAPGDWTLKDLECSGEKARLKVWASVPVCRSEIVTGWESRLYLEKTELPVLEIEVGPGKAELTTEIILGT